MTHSSDKYDSEVVIKRLLGEIRQINAVLTSAKDALRSGGERLLGLTLLGGIATLRRQRDAAEAEVRVLKRELDRVTHERKKGRD
jgi:hypothetical protein